MPFISPASPGSHAKVRKAQPMTALTPAAQAIIQALADPKLDAPQRAGLAAALAAVMASEPQSMQAAPGRTRRVTATKVERKADAIVFGKESVAALALPAQGERYVYDTVCPQLAVRLRPGGRTYMVQTWDRERHRSTRVTLGKTDILTPEQARKKAQVLVASVSEGVDVRRPARDDLTLALLIESWHAAKAKSMRTADEMRDKALDYLGGLDSRPAAQVTREDIGRIHHAIATEGQRRVLRNVDGLVQLVKVGKVGIPATADKWLAIMSSVFGWAAKKGLVPDNPCRGIAKAFGAKESARTTYLHGDALLRFWAALEADPDADTRDLFLLALYTGQRKGNVLAMRWAHVDLDAGLWTIPGSETKQKSAQSNPLSAQARMILARRHSDAGTAWVFPAVRRGKGGEVGHMTESRPRDAWERITKAAGVEDVRIHDLRHTAGSWLARLGSNEAVRQKALGHQTPAMAARYSHLELDPVADAMQRMGDAITAAATKPPAGVRKFAPVRRGSK